MAGPCSAQPRFAPHENLILPFFFPFPVVVPKPKRHFQQAAAGGWKQSNNKQEEEEEKSEIFRLRGVTNQPESCCLGRGWGWFCCSDGEHESAAHGQGVLMAWNELHEGIASLEGFKTTLPTCSVPGRKGPCKASSAAAVPWLRLILAMPGN